MKFGAHVFCLLLLALCAACQGTPSPGPTMTTPGAETAAAQTAQAYPGTAPAAAPVSTIPPTNTLPVPTADPGSLFR
ncbi:MAG: hypothetical protein MUC85_07970 [Anaerolineales bacterium]|nr:hypothetical protein [Anaerolineales bacterium]